VEVLYYSVGTTLSSHVYLLNIEDFIMWCTIVSVGSFCKKYVYHLAIVNSFTRSVFEWSTGRIIGSIK